MRKTGLIALTLGLLIAGTAVVFGQSSDSSAPTVGTTSTTTTTTGTDISGPCDEAEHANDPECTGGAVREEDRSGRDHPEDDGTSDVGEDISGPCDEAEHANDPECVGVSAAGTPIDDDAEDRYDDSSGPGSGDDDRYDDRGGDDHDEDRWDDHGGDDDDEYDDD